MNEHVPGGCGVHLAIPHHLDMVSINLNFRKRSLPIFWELRPTAMTGAETQKNLLNRCKPLIPSDWRVVFHGDNEFGSVAVMEGLRGEQWEFILGQSTKPTFGNTMQLDFYHALQPCRERSVVFGFALSKWQMPCS